MTLLKVALSPGSPVDLAGCKGRTVCRQRLGGTRDGWTALLHYQQMTHAHLMRASSTPSFPIGQILLRLVQRNSTASTLTSKQRIQKLGIKRYRVSVAIRLNLATV